MLILRFIVDLSYQPRIIFNEYKQIIGVIYMNYFSKNKESALSFFFA